MVQRTSIQPNFRIRRLKTGAEDNSVGFNICRQGNITMNTQRDSSPTNRAKFSSAIFACIAIGAGIMVLSAHEGNRPMEFWLYLAACVGGLIASVAVRRSK
jgi:hypothetical protein